MEILVSAGQRLSDLELAELVEHGDAVGQPLRSRPYIVELARELEEARAGLREAGALLDFVFTAADNGYPFHREHDTDGVRAKIAALLPEEVQG